MDLAALPGHELVQEGLADLDAGRMSAASLLVLIGADRLRRIGLSISRISIALQSIRARFAKPWNGPSPHWRRKKGGGPVCQ